MDSYTVTTVQGKSVSVTITLADGLVSKQVLNNMPVESADDLKAALEAYVLAFKAGLSGTSPEVDPAVSGLVGKPQSVGG